MNEGEQLKKAQNGDVDAFAELFESYRQMMFAVACRLTGPDDADDVVMESYLKAWRALPKFSGKASLKTWLYRITHNCALDFLRKRGRKQKRFVREDDDHPISNLADDGLQQPGDDMVQSEEYSLVNRALMKLDDIHRVALQMRYTDDMSYADIAAATDVSIGTVMSRLFNAKKKLKTAIAELEKEEWTGNK